MLMPSLAKLSSKGQLTAPVEVRKALQLKTGDTLAWEVQSREQISARCRFEPVELA